MSSQTLSSFIQNLEVNEVKNIVFSLLKSPMPNHNVLVKVKDSYVLNNSLKGVIICPLGCFCNRNVNQIGNITFKCNATSENHASKPIQSLVRLWDMMCMVKNKSSELSMINKLEKSKKSDMYDISLDRKRHFCSVNFDLLRDAINTMNMDTYKTVITFIREGDRNGSIKTEESPESIYDSFFNKKEPYLSQLHHMRLALYDMCVSNTSLVICEIRKLRPSLLSRLFGDRCECITDKCCSKTCEDSLKYYQKKTLNEASKTASEHVCEKTHLNDTDKDLRINATLKSRLLSMCIHNINVTYLYYIIIAKPDMSDDDIIALQLIENN